MKNSSSPNSSLQLVVDLYIFQKTVVFDHLGQQIAIYFSLTTPKRVLMKVAFTIN